jgi:hypothetical protein
MTNTKTGSINATYSVGVAPHFTDEQWIELGEMTQKLDDWERMMTGKHIVIVSVRPWYPRYLWRKLKADRFSKRIAKAYAAANERLDSNGN